MPLACLTNKPTAFALPLLQAKGLDGYFAHVFGATPSSARNRTRCPAQNLRSPGH